MDTQKNRFSLFDTPLDPLTYHDVLEKIKKYLSDPPVFRHIVSINPENIILAQDNAEYRDVCHKSDLALTDGIGVMLAAKILGKNIPERIPGSFLLPRLLDLAGAMSSRVLLIGSQANLAANIAECYSRSYPKATYIGMEGYKNKLKPTKEEVQAIEDIVRNTRPHFVFVSFGSPFQELWIYSHRALLKDSICMGVGGAFNYLSGVSRRPPQLIAQLGLEWLYRLASEPWRIHRQLSRLPRFVLLVLKQWFSGV
ncbi:MAG: WecB/TagA/CpsF family glycosyltransferase [Microgenomates group bacterium]